LRTRLEQEDAYRVVLADAMKRDGQKEVHSMMREIALRDLYFLLTVVLNRHDVRHDWLYERCMEVQKNPNGYLDLWSREHYKSTIISFALTIQDILRDPEITVGIFSCTRPLAKRLLRQIKFELESNAMLKKLFPEILYADPRKESPKWSEDDGIIVKRKSNPAASTVEAWGLVDGQPTGKHFSLMVYDDVVTRESVTSPDMIRKVTEAWELSLNLGAHGGRFRYIGTRYHMNDTYKTIMERGSAIDRIYPATENGKPDGEPVFLDRETLARKRRDMGPYTFSSQMLQDPTADDAQGFDIAWLKHTRIEGTAGMNLYIVVDPAGEKKKDSDYTVMLVIGLAQDDNYYLVDMVRDRMNLTERGEKLMELHRTYKPKAVGYEKYGLQADIEFIEYLQKSRTYNFTVTKLGGAMPKNDRIRKLVPLFEQGRIFLPMTHHYVDYQGRSSDLVRDFVDQEYVSFPVSNHDDMLDCLARIVDQDLGATFPKVIKPQNITRKRRRSGMAA
jgi:predicted phage terminase large subunit-like protein